MIPLDPFTLLGLAVTGARDDRKFTRELRETQAQRPSTPPYNPAAATFHLTPEMTDRLRDHYQKVTAQLRAGRHPLQILD